MEIECAQNTQKFDWKILCKIYCDLLCNYSMVEIVCPDDAFLSFCERSKLAKFMLLMKCNRPFLSSFVALFQKESKCKTICMKMKLHAELIFVWKVSLLDLFWNRGTRYLGNGLLAYFPTVSGWNRIYRIRPCSLVMCLHHSICIPQTCTCS